MHTSTIPTSALTANRRFTFEPCRFDTAATPVHHFTVDVEEHFQVSAFEPFLARERWTSLESRVDANTNQLLDLLARYNARGTFFVLGWIAQRHPGLVSRIVDAGHELASHGWGHRRVTTLDPETFRASVRDSRAILEDLSGSAVLGYRAPSFSIVPGLEWAVDILIEEGYRYDSSLFPIARRGYGYPTAPRVPARIHASTGTLHEFPPATLRRFGITIPAGGGGYLRHFPLAATRAALRDFARAGVPATIYVHPWEIDPDQPRLAVPALVRVRHYGGLRRMLPRLHRLLAEFAFGRVCDAL